MPSLHMLGSEGDFLSMFGPVLCVGAEQANMESGQACAVKAAKLVYALAVRNLLNMFGLMPELDVSHTRAAAFWTATSTVTTVGVGSHAQANLACMLCPFLSCPLLSSVFCSKPASLLHCLIFCQLQMHLSLSGTRQEV